MARTLPSSPREIGRIRLGDQQPTKGGKMAPHKLEHFRLTSDSHSILESAAKHYGGEVTPWPANDRHPHDEWQLYTTKDFLEVTVPIDHALSVSYEQWSAGGCTLRCDGTKITHCPLEPHKIDTACQCTDDQDDACPRILRMNVLLRNVSGLGVWRLESKGFYATAELINDMEKFQWFGIRGMLVPALLRLKFREVRKLTLDPKTKQKKHETRHFYVPCLEFQITPEEFQLAMATHRPELLLPPAQREALALPAPPLTMEDSWPEPVDPTAHSPAAQTTSNGNDHPSPPENEREKRATVAAIDMELKRKGIKQADYWTPIFHVAGVETKRQLTLDALQQYKAEIEREDFMERWQQAQSISQEPDAEPSLTMTQPELQAALADERKALIDDQSESGQGHFATITAWLTLANEGEMGPLDIQAAIRSLEASQAYRGVGVEA